VGPPPGISRSPKCDMGRQRGSEMLCLVSLRREVCPPEHPRNTLVVETDDLIARRRGFVGER
jgi:hypothetical protein